MTPPPQWPPWHGSATPPATPRTPTTPRMTAAVPAVQPPAEGCRTPAAIWPPPGTRADGCGGSTCPAADSEDCGQGHHLMPEWRLPQPSGGDVGPEIASAVPAVASAA